VDGIRNGVGFGLTLSGLVLAGGLIWGAYWLLFGRDLVPLLVVGAFLLAGRCAR
jgi:hypothetical protein